MTRLDLQNMVLAWLDDVNGTYFTPNVVQTWLNNALVEVQKQLIQAGENWYLTSAQTVLIANQDTYVLPSDFRKMDLLELIISGTGVNENKRTLNYKTTMEFTKCAYGPGTPWDYTFKKNCLMLREVPSSAYVLRASYSYMVSPMTSDTSVPDVPTQYEEYIAVIATLDGFLRDGRDPSQMQSKEAKYLKLMKADAQNRDTSSPRMVRTVGDYDMGNFF